MIGEYKHCYKEENEDSIQEGGIIMEYMSGGNLSDILYPPNEDPPNKIALTEKTRLEIIKKITEELNCLHKLGITHRDLKSDNIFIQLENSEIKEVKIGDFGHSEESLEGPKTTCGTLIYNPPELLNDGKAQIDYTKTDIYCLGVVINEILKNQQPLYERNIDLLSNPEKQIKEIVLQDREGEIIQEKNCPKSLKPLIPLIQSCWDSNSKNRPSTDKILEKIDEIISQTTSLTPSISI